MPFFLSKALFRHLLYKCWQSAQEQKHKFCFLKTTPRASHWHRFHKHQTPSRPARSFQHTWVPQVITWILQTPKPFQTDCDHFQHPEQVSNQKWHQQMVHTVLKISANVLRCEELRKLVLHKTTTKSVRFLSCKQFTPTSIFSNSEEAAWILDLQNPLNFLLHLPSGKLCMIPIVGFLVISTNKTFSAHYILHCQENKITAGSCTQFQWPIIWYLVEELLLWYIQSCSCKGSSLLWSPFGFKHWLCNTMWQWF